jgi:hypothetical protein
VAPCWTHAKVRNGLLARQFLARSPKLFCAQISVREVRFSLARPICFPRHVYESMDMEEMEEIDDRRVATLDERARGVIEGPFAISVRQVIYWLLR